VRRASIAREGAAGSAERFECALLGASDMVPRLARAGKHAQRIGSVARGGNEPCASGCIESTKWRDERVDAATLRLLQASDTEADAGASYNRHLMAGTIMIVEDEPAVARGVQVALEREGYAVSVQPTGEDALANFADAAPDLVVLDVRLPGMDGFEVLRQLRRETRAPVLFLTARSDEVDKVVGLELGADDYLVKPFSVRELVSRIKALLRRAYGELADTETGRTLRRKNLVIDLERRRVTRDGERIGLTTTEFDLLRHLAARPGRCRCRRGPVARRRPCRPRTPSPPRGTSRTAPVTRRE